MTKSKVYFGMKLVLRDAGDRGVFNTLLVEAKPNQTLDSAYAEARSTLEEKREAWRRIYPDTTFEIVQVD